MANGKDDDKMVAFRMPEDEHKAAMEKAKKQERTLSQVLRLLVRRWLRDPNEEVDE